MGFHQSFIIFIYCDIISLAGLKLFYTKKPESIIGLGLVSYLMLMLKTPFHVLAEPILIYLYFVTALAISISLSKPKYLKN